MTKDAFIKGMTIIKEAFPKRQLNASIYFEALKDISDIKFLDSILKIVQRTAKLYPDDNLIAIIRENVSGSAKDCASLAWADARGAIISIGVYETVSFNDRVINGTIQAMGGWEKFCSMKIEEEPFRKKDFCELYTAIFKTGRHCPEKLIGYAEKTNGTPGEVCLIGEIKKSSERKPDLICDLAKKTAEALSWPGNKT